MTSEPIAVTLLVTEALEALDVPYFVGGSLASALHGEPRATLDSDLVADLRPQHVRPLVHMLQDEFYIDEVAVCTAVQRRNSFNVLHLATMFKVDVFVMKQRAFAQMQFARARPMLVTSDPDRYVLVASAEDMILAKLEWYRLGGEVSERQWRDVMGIVKVQEDRLDWDYLQQQAGALGVADLLAKLKT